MSGKEQASILLVDDEKVILSLLTQLLTRHGYDVAVAANKKDAEALILGQPFDLLVIDKNLPDGSGLDIVSRARKMGLQAEIIIVTGFADVESTIAAVQHGVYRYIQKPFDIDQIVLEIRGALDTGKLRRRLSQRTWELEVANDQLKLSEQRFRELTDLLPCIVIEIDEQGLLTFVNQTGPVATGYTKQGFFSHFNDYSLFAEDDRGRLARELDQALGGEDIGVDEYTLVRSDGTMAVFIARFSIIANDDQVLGLRGIFFDITRRKEAARELHEKEEKLRLAQKLEAIGTLAGGVAHDFNNMLTAINTYGELALSEIDEYHPCREHLDGILEAAKRSSGLTRQLLLFSRKQSLDPHIIDLNNVVREIKKMLTRLIRDDIRLNLKLGAGLPSIFADQGQLEQVIMNLVVNARDAMPDGGDLTIETSHVSGEPNSPGDAEPARLVVLSVSDDGIGMDEKTIKRIFEPFYTTKEAERGTGLGLATVYEIVKRSGGEVRVRSTLGKGSCFDLSFPYFDGVVDARDSLPPDIMQLSGSETILLVEDERVVREVVAATLRTYGYTVLESSEPEEAYLLCVKHEGKIDLVFTDVIMPGLSGPELARKIRNLYPEIPVLYMSGYSDEPVVREVSLNRSGQFLQKPFTSWTLGRKIRDLLTH